MNSLPKEFKIHVPTPELNLLVQKRLFEMGFKWCGGIEDGVKNCHSHYNCLAVSKKAKGIVVQAKSRIDLAYDFSYVTIEELFTTPVNPVFALNDQWSARVEGGIVRAEGQGQELTFSFETLKELKAALDNYRKSTLPECFKIHVPAPELSELVQRKLFSLDKGWCAGGKNEIVKNGEVLFVRKNEISQSSKRYADNERNDIPYLSIEELFSSPKQPELKIGKHEVRIFEDVVEVGCQTFEKEKVVQFVEAALK